jgi:hypothetical protein
MRVALARYETCDVVNEKWSNAAANDFPGHSFSTHYPYVGGNACRMMMARDEQRNETWAEQYGS